MKVVCFYWQGDRWQEPGKGRDPVDESFRKHVVRTGPVTQALVSRYVNNLYDGVKKYASRDFDFICFTNEPLDVQEGITLQCLPMVTTRGVLPRLYMFSEAAGLFGHQVLSLDLDIVITGGLENIMAYDGVFCTRTTFAPREGSQLDGDIMSFRAGKAAERIFWTPFLDNPEAVERLTEGRERRWVRHVAESFADTWDTVAPGEVVSYKRQVMKMRHHDTLPKRYRIVSCHGYPRPHQIDPEKEPWIKQYWK